MNVIRNREPPLENNPIENHAILQENPIRTALDAINALSQGAQLVAERNARVSLVTRQCICISALMNTLSLIFTSTSLPSSVERTLPSPQTIFHDRLNAYMVENIDAPWMKTILDRLDDFNIDFSRGFPLYYVYLTSNIFHRTLSLQVAIPARDDSNIAGAVFGLNTSGFLMGLLSIALNRFGWVEPPLSFREFWTLYQHCGTLLDYQARNVSDEEDQEQGNLIAIDPQEVESTLARARILERGQFISYGRNCLDVIYYVALSAILYGLYLAAEKICSPLKTYNFADFDENVVTPNSWKYQPLNATYHVGPLSLPLPGLVEYFRDGEPVYASESTNQQILNRLVVPTFLYATLPHAVGLVAKGIATVYYRIRDARQPEVIHENVDVLREMIVENNPEDEEDPYHADCGGNHHVVPHENNLPHEEHGMSSEDDEIPWGNQLD